MSRIKRQFIEDNAVNGQKIRLDNNEAIRARNAAGTADVDVIKLTATDKVQIPRTLSLNNFKIEDVALPTALTDVATKQYVDMILKGLEDAKQAVRVATSLPLPASVYDNGTLGTGATLTGAANGPLPAIDSVTLVVGNRILVKNQVNAFENGIYEVTQVGDAGQPFVLTRAEDANIGGGDATVEAPAVQVTQGMLVPVAEGAVNGSLGFILTTVDPISLGVSNLSFTQFGEVVQAGLGLQKTGQILSVDAGEGLSFQGNELAVNVDNASLVDGTTKIVAGQIAGKRSFREVIVLSAADVTNGYIDLAKVASRDSIILQPDGGPKQNEALDFSVNYTAGAGSKTRITFLGDLANPTVLGAGSTVYVNYQSLDY